MDPNNHLQPSEFILYLEFWPGGLVWDGWIKTMILDYFFGNMNFNKKKMFFSIVLWPGSFFVPWLVLVGLVITSGSDYMCGSCVFCLCWSIICVCEYCCATMRDTDEESVWLDSHSISSMWFSKVKIN